MANISTMPGADRLEKLENLFIRKKHNSNQLCWIKYNPSSEFNYDIINAEEDVQWMIYEIKKLNRENKELKEFIDTLRRQLEAELGVSQGDDSIDR